MKGCAVKSMWLVLILMVKLVAVDRQEVIAMAMSLSCGEVEMCLLACMDYLTHEGANPNAACCDGVENLRSITPTAPDRQIACLCLKEAANSYSDVKDDEAASLPAKCHVPTQITISRTINCTRDINQVGWT